MLCTVTFSKSTLIFTKTFSLKYDKIYILLEKDNDFEEEIVHLFNEINIFISKFETNYNQSGSKYTQKVYRTIG